jgi:hypothetical protein
MATRPSYSRSRPSVDARRLLNLTTSSKTTVKVY